MATTIQVSNKLAQELKNRKMYDKESYEEIIWDLIEDTVELSQLKEGRYGRYMWEKKLCKGVGEITDSFGKPLYMFRIK